jgi:hypothetical protein
VTPQTLRHDKKFAQSVLALEAMARPDWETFIAALREYREQCVKDLLVSGPDQIGRNQGRANSADEILTAITGARTLLNK